MLVIVGLIVVTASVIGGFVLEGGHLLVLHQPAEFLIIGGSAIGTLLIGTPMGVLKQLMSQLGSMLRGSAGKEPYIDLLAMLSQLFRVSQQGGIMALESHFEAPAQSTVISKYPGFLARRDAVDFLADSVKVMIVGGISAHDLEMLMEEDLEVRHHEAGRPAVVLNRIADALPGLGIVAAVLGVVITMGSIDGPAAELGHKVGAALIGTFLGILLSYGFTQPLAANLEQRVTDDRNYLICIKTGLGAIYKGHPPAVAIEFARRVLPDALRPTFEETEQLCRPVRAEAA